MAASLATCGWTAKVGAGVPINSGWAVRLVMMAAFLAVGMLFSALSRNQVVAFILGVAASALFLLLGLPQVLEIIG